jgi:hypothetical protein
VKPGQTVAPTRVAMNFDQSGLQQVAVTATPVAANVESSTTHAQP